MRAGALLSTLFLSTGIAIAVACSSDDSSDAPLAANAGAPETGTCNLGNAPSNAACMPASSIVCNVVGASVTCCPTNAPFYCPANNDCYATQAAAYSACGNLPHACIACPPPGPPPEGTDASQDATSGDGAGDDGATPVDASGPDANGGPDAEAGADANADANADASADAQADAGADANGVDASDGAPE